MSNFTVRLQGLTEVRGKLPQIPKEIERTVILRLSQIVYEQGFAGASRHSKTGALLQSLYNRAIPGGREIGHDPQRAPHALFVNVGTRPHVIRPKDKKALRWVVGNRFVFAKEVHHPGYRGDAYMIAAATEALRQFKQIVDQATKDAAP